MAPPGVAQLQSYQQLANSSTQVTQLQGYQQAANLGAKGTIQRRLNKLGHMDDDESPTTAEAILQKYPHATPTQQAVVHEMAAQPNEYTFALTEAGTIAPAEFNRELNRYTPLAPESPALRQQLKTILGNHQLTDAHVPILDGLLVPILAELAEHGHVVMQMENHQNQVVHEAGEVIRHHWGLDSPERYVKWVVFHQKHTLDDTHITTNVKKNRLLGNWDGPDESIRRMIDIDLNGISHTVIDIISPGFTELLEALVEAKVSTKAAAGGHVAVAVPRKPMPAATWVHIWRGDYNGKPTGYHWAGNPNSWLEAVPGTRQNAANNFYTAQVRIRPGKQQEVKNQGKDTKGQLVLIKANRSTFFPDGWNAQQVKDAVETRNNIGHITQPAGIDNIRLVKAGITIYPTLI